MLSPITPNPNPNPNLENIFSCAGIGKFSMSSIRSRSCPEFTVIILRAIYELTALLDAPLRT